MFEICTAFNHNRICYFFMGNEMVVSTQNQIDSFDLFGQFDIIVFHHVGEGNDEVALLLCPKFMDHFLGEGDEGMVVTYGFVVGVEGINPLLFGQAENPYFQSIAVEYVAFQSLTQSSSRSLVIYVAEQPGEVGLFDQFGHVIKLIIKIMVTVACKINSKGIERFDHILTLELVGDKGWGEGIT